MFRQDLSGRFEDGTINFLDIIALGHSFDTMEKLYTSFYFIKDHLNALSTYLYRQMSSLRHSNGNPLCYIHSNTDYTDSSVQGPIFNFNMKRADGSWIGYREVELSANERRIHIRTGGFCNPGSTSKWVKLNPDQVMENFMVISLFIMIGFFYVCISLFLYISFYILFCCYRKENFVVTKMIFTKEESKVQYVFH